MITKEQKIANLETKLQYLEKFKQDIDNQLEIIKQQLNSLRNES